jgi:adenosylcobyric acid synthase
MEELCGVPVLGVVPMLDDIGVEAEDSVALGGKRTRAADPDNAVHFPHTTDLADPARRRVNVAVVRLPHISNFTDFDALERDPRAHLYYTDDAEELSRAEVIILPGSKSTIADLGALRERGLDRVIARAHGRGTTVMGICGGYQMMGREVRDPHRVEGGAEFAEGLGLLPVATTMSGEKVTRRRTFRTLGGETQCTGYEIHMGRTSVVRGEECGPVAFLDDGMPEGCRAPGAIGTYLHGCLDNAAVRDLLLARLAGHLTEAGADRATFKERQYDRLADHVRRHVDMARIYQILTAL